MMHRKETMKKGMLLSEGHGKRVYQVAGTWNGCFVLAPVDPLDEQVLIYEKNELQGLIDTGHFNLADEKSE